MSADRDFSIVGSVFECLTGSAAVGILTLVYRHVRADRLVGDRQELVHSSEGHIEPFGQFFRARLTAGLEQHSA
jgi:hypothetical protein